MNRTLATFLLVALSAGLLAALSIAVAGKGYAFGELGVARLGVIATGGTFIPLAALYSFSAMLMMILPLRAAGLVHANVASPVCSTALVLLATILGVQAARLAFGSQDALETLLDWRFLFALAIVGAHLAASELRRDVLLRTLAFVGFAATTLACLYWTFSL